MRLIIYLFLIMACSLTHSQEDTNLSSMLITGKYNNSDYLTKNSKKDVSYLHLKPSGDFIFKSSFNSVITGRWTQKGGELILEPIFTNETDALIYKIKVKDSCVHLKPMKLQYPFGLWPLKVKMKGPKAQYFSQPEKPKKKYPHITKEELTSVTETSLSKIVKKYYPYFELKNFQIKTIDNLDIPDSIEIHQNFDGLVWYDKMDGNPESIRIRLTLIQFGKAIVQNGKLVKLKPESEKLIHGTLWKS